MVSHGEPSFANRLSLHAAVLPHPNPLPEGEGSASPPLVVRQAHYERTRRRPSTTPPVPLMVSLPSLIAYPCTRRFSLTLTLSQRERGAHPAPRSTSSYERTAPSTPPVPLMVSLPSLIAYPCALTLSQRERGASATNGLAGGPPRQLMVSLPPLIAYPCMRRLSLTLTLSQRERGAHPRRRPRPRPPPRS